MTRPSELGRCRDCGARPHLTLDADGAPLGATWDHKPTCPRPPSEDARLRGLAKERGADPTKLLWTKSKDAGD